MYQTINFKFVIYVIGKLKHDAYRPTTADDKEGGVTSTATKQQDKNAKANATTDSTLLSQDEEMAKYEKILHQSSYQ